MVHRIINPWFQMSLIVFLYMYLDDTHILKYFICVKLNLMFVYNKHLSRSSLSRILRPFLIETLSGDLTCLLRSIISTMLSKRYST